MNDNEKVVDNILSHIVQEISITPTMAAKAVDSYEAVGKWIGEGIPYDVRISPQGSMSLGTTNKPVSDKDDYDIDLVCLLEDGSSLTAREIKTVVGNRLKENCRYYKKILEEGEGTRCWKMQYDEFHMDILPCVPKKLYLEPICTEIRLTHKDKNQGYEDRFSNPFGYMKWFEERMGNVLQDEKRNYASASKMKIEDVPNFRVKTPLQSVVQLLKRHRDICFERDPVNAPISIIITTLASKSYRGEASIYDAMCNILAHMTDYITVKNGIYWVENPVMQQENFADKWTKHPERKTAFADWLKRAKKELIDDPLGVYGIDQIQKCYAKSLGEAPVNRAIKAIGYEMRESGNNNLLYSTGLSTGLASGVTPGSKQIKEHTFFGQ